MNEPQQQPGSSPSRIGALIFGGLMVAVIVVLVIVLTGGDDDGSDGDETAAAGECETGVSVSAKQVDIPKPTANEPTASEVVFETSCGSFTVTLDSEQAPKTTASFQYLAEEGVFDGTPFHRVAPGFVIQAGDPSGDGTGGPGYSVTEAPPDDLSYTRGLVAMAKTGEEPPGTSGSQFFVITAEADAGLAPDFALVGEVTDGLDTVLAIEELGGGPGTDGPPSQPVVIESATVEG